MRTAHFGGTPASARKLCVETSEHLKRFGIENIDGPPSEAGASAVDAARHYLRGEPVAFEFFEAKVKQWQVMLQRFESSRTRWITTAAAVVIALPLLVMFIRNQYENHLINEWNAMKSNVADIDAIQQRIHKFRPWFEPAPQVLQVMESVIAAFPEQGDVWAKSLQVGEGHKVTCAGFARNEAALLALLDRLRKNPGVTALQVQQMRGDNPVQFSFTCKWESQQ